MKNPGKSSKPDNISKSNRNIRIAIENSILGVTNVPMAATAIYNTVSGTNIPTDTAKSLINKPPITPKEVVSALVV